jgi:hypothetical protein
MKKLLTLLALGTSLCASQAAVTLNSTNYANGLVTTDNAALASGSLRFGVFPALFDFAANSANLPALETAFVQVYSYTGAIREFDTDGFFTVSQSVDNTASFEGQSYATSIAGQKVFLWVQNPGATEQAIFSTSTTWNSGVGLPPFESNFSPDTGAPGLVAHIGTLAVGQDLGAGAPAHMLAVVVPEPSVTLSVVMGGLALLVRRRR